MGGPEERGFAQNSFLVTPAFSPFFQNVGVKWESQTDRRDAKSIAAVESLQRVSSRGELVVHSKERVALS